MTTKDKSHLYWEHLRILASDGYLPKFTSKNNHAKRMCFNSQLGMFTDVWCERCLKGKKCDNCHLAIRFKAQKKILRNSHIEVSRQPQLDTEPSLHTSSFKGVEFTNHLLPFILYNIPSPCYLIPQNLRNVVADKALTTLTKVQKLLHIVYVDEQKTVQDVKSVLESAAVWIAPTREENARVSLLHTIHLSNENCFKDVADGFYNVWSFNSHDVYKWHTLQTGDMVLFGNARYGFGKLGKVIGKFIWRNNFASNIYDYTNSWLYGFILNMETQREFNIPSWRMRQIFRCHFQSQTRVDDLRKQKLVLEEISHLSKKAKKQKN